MRGRPRRLMGAAARGRLGISRRGPAVNQQSRKGTQYGAVFGRMRSRFSVRPAPRSDTNPSAVILSHMRIA